MYFSTKMGRTVRQMQLFFWAKIKTKKVVSHTSFLMCRLQFHLRFCGILPKAAHKHNRGQLPPPPPPADNFENQARFSKIHSAERESLNTKLVDRRAFSKYTKTSSGALLGNRLCKMECQSGALLKMYTTIMVDGRGFQFIIHLTGALLRGNVPGIVDRRAFRNVQYSSHQYSR